MGSCAGYAVVEGYRFNGVGWLEIDTSERYLPHLYAEKVFFYQVKRRWNFLFIEDDEQAVNCR